MSAKPPKVMRDVLSVGLIGGGVNSAVGRAHVSALKMDGLFKIVAGAFSRDPKINLQSALEFDVHPSRAYADHISLIQHESNNLNAVIVLTPTPFHTAPVVAALKAGIPVICEKTLTSNINDAKLIQNIENNSKGFLVVTYNYTAFPSVRELKELVSSGAIGEVLHFAIEMPQEGYLRLDSGGEKLITQKWRQVDAEIPVIYLDLGSHLHQIANYILGVRPISVYAVERTYGAYQVVDYVSASVKYENNIHGSFVFGKTMLGYRNGLKIRIFGRTGALEWAQCDPERIQMSHADGRIELLDRGGGGLAFSSQRYSRFKAGHPAGYIEAFANLYEDIHNALHQFATSGSWHSQELFDSSHSIDGLTLMAAMHESAIRDTVIQVESIK